MAEEIKEEKVGITEEEFNEVIGTWDQAITSGKFIKLDEDEPKELVITNWKIIKTDKFQDDKNSAPKYEFVSEVVEEDGKAVSEKVFSTTSNGLKTKLRPIFENKDPTTKVKIRLMKVGEGFDTKYSVKEL